MVRINIGNLYFRCKRKAIFINFLRVLWGVDGSSCDWLQKHFHNWTSRSTLRKSVGIWSYSSLHFPAFGLNTEKCGPKSLRNPLPADHLRINKINNNPKRFVLVYPIFRWINKIKLNYFAVKLSILLQNHLQYKNKFTWISGVIRWIFSDCHLFCLITPNTDVVHAVQSNQYFVIFHQNIWGRLFEIHLLLNPGSLVFSEGSVLQAYWFEETFFQAEKWEYLNMVWKWNYGKSF